MELICKTNFKKINDIYIRRFAKNIISWQETVIRDKKKHILNPGRGNNINKNEYLRQISQLKKRGAKVRNGGLSVYINRISPGCIHCGELEGYTVELSKNCNRDCFFCFDQRPPPKILLESLRLADIKNILLKIRRDMPLSSFAISGGEPLLLFNTVLKSIEFAKKITNNKCQTRIYTNGDFLNEEKLKMLKKNGLDEIRIGLKPEQIDINVVYRASRFIRRVMVEMPVFPDKQSDMECLLLELNKIGIFGINLLEFLYCGHNANEYVKRGYFLKTTEERPIYDVLDADGSNYPIAKSEELCLALLRFAIDRRLSLGVHYCSFENKRYAYVKSRIKNAKRNQNPYQSITNDGLFKSLVIFGADWYRAYKTLKKNKVDDKQIAISEDKDRLLTRLGNKKFLDRQKYNMGVIYTLPNKMAVNLELL